MRTALESAPPPAWLAHGGPDADVILSSRVRLMRNLRAYPFPHRADSAALMAVMRQILQAARARLPGFTADAAVNAAERAYWVAARLMSPDFPIAEPGRAIVHSPERDVMIMINEEDHLRIQAITPGYSPAEAERLAVKTAEALASVLPLALHPRYGFLAASPSNCGAGRRRSVMFHLVGLAGRGRLPAVISALGEERLAFRGLFGETSRALGAFAQVSTVRASTDEFAGACDYVMAAERAARAELDPELLAERADQAEHLIRTARGLSLGDATRCLAWLRAAQPKRHLTFDRALTALEPPAPDEEAAGRRRAQGLRRRLDL